MKVRIKFSKQGQMKFIGHLDIMRYFQKAIKRAGIDIAYSEGFSPHQKMSFAAPLGLGVVSRAEYFDIDVNSLIPSKKALRLLNNVMVDGMSIISYRLLPDNAGNCMAIIAAADYLVHLSVEGEDYTAFTEDNIKNFMKLHSISVIKKTKKSEKEVDIKPLILNMEYRNGDIFMKVKSGSAENLKPELVLDAYCNYYGISKPDVLIERLEMYSLVDEQYISLEDLGDDID